MNSWVSQSTNRYKGINVSMIVKPDPTAKQKPNIYFKILSNTQVIAL